MSLIHAILHITTKEKGKKTRSLMSDIDPASLASRQASMLFYQHFVCQGLN
jgi:hypothetical protein